MTMQRLLRLAFAVLVGACGPSLPPPVSPLVPTPDAAWRRSAPAPATSRERSWPSVQWLRLDNGLRASIATLAGASYVVVTLTVDHERQQDAAVQLARTLRVVFQDDAPFVLEDSVDQHHGLTIGLRCAPPQLEPALQQLSTVVQTSLTRAHVQAAERGRVLEQDYSNLDAGDAALRHLRAKLQPSHAGARQPSEPLSHIQLEELRQRLFTGSHLRLFVTGAVDEDRALQQVRASFEGLPSGMPVRSAVSAAEPERSGGEPDVGAVVFVPWSTRSALVQFGFRLPASAYDQWVEIDLLSRMLGDGVSALLNQGVREQRGLSYAVGTTFELNQDGGMVWGSLVAPPEHVADVLDALRSQFRRARGAMTVETFELARQRSRAHLWSIAADAQAMSDHLQGSAGQRPPSQVAELWRKLDAVDASSVAELGDALLRRPLFVVVGPTSARAALQWDDAPVEDVHGAATNGPE